MRDAWEILGITPTENKRAIKKAYAKMLAKYHPEEYPDEFIEIQNAYQSIMDSLERDYQKPESLSIDLAEGFHKKDTIYLKTPFVEQDTRSDFDGGFPHQDLFPDLDIELIHEEKPKQEDESFYDDLDLSWSFQNQDDKPKKKHIMPDLDIDIIHGDKPKQEGDTFYDDPNISVHHNTKVQKEYVKEVYKQEDNEIIQDTTDQDVKDYLYLRFEERIKFSCRTDVMKDLILNQTFFDAIGDKQFYIKISALIRTKYAQFDSITKSFLYDAFSYIETNLHYSNTDENSITNFIAVEKLRAEKEKIRKQKAEKRNIIIFIVCMFAFVIAVQLISKEQRKQEQAKQEQMREFFVDQKIVEKNEKEEIREAMKKNKEQLETYMLETYSTTYSCYVLDVLYEPNSSLYFTCRETQNSESKKTGNIKIGEDRLVTEIDVIDVDSTIDE